MNARAVPDPIVPPTGRAGHSRGAMVAVLSGAFLLLSQSPSRPAVPEFATTAPWVEVRTRNFTVVTDAGSRTAWDVARKLERFSAALAQLNPGLSAGSPLPTTAFVFRNQAELDLYRPAASENVVAFFHPGEDRNLLVLNGTPDGTSRSEVVFHEFVHCYLSANFPAVPLWLNEGLAEYYSTCRLTRGGAEFGKPNMNVVNWMKGRPTLSLGMMFALRPEDPAYRRDNDLRSQFYAQSYLFTHALQSPNGGLAERFDRFLATLGRGAQPMLAFREQFPAEEGQGIINGLDEYIGRIEFEPTRRVVVPPESDSQDREPRELPAAETLTRLGELALLLGGDREAFAAEHFVAALEIDPGFAPARAARGLAADLAGRAVEAESHYAGALAAAPNDAAILKIAARGTVSRLLDAADAGAHRDTVLAIGRLARERYRLSLRISPGDLEAHGGVGVTYAVVGDEVDTMTVHQLERAVRALPSQTRLAAALAVLETRQGHVREAETLMAQRVAPGSRAADLKGLQEFVRGADLARANQLAAEGRFGEAESLARVVAQTSSDARIQGQARELAERVGGQRVRQDVVATADRALSLAVAGRLDEAKTLLVEARNQAPAGELRRELDLALLRLDAETLLRRAVDLTNGGRLREAEAALVEGDGRWPDDEYRARAARALSEIRGRREIERALGLAKAGRLVEARSALGGVLRMEVPDAMKTYVRERIRELDAALRGQ